MLGQYTKAAAMYKMGGLISKCIECYEVMKNWDAILQCIKDHEKDFTFE